MRETTISSISVLYPDDLVWKNDTSTIKLMSGTNGVGGMIYIEDPAGVAYTLEYYSDKTEIVFDLTDAIRGLYSDNIGVWRCRVTGFDQGIPLGDFSFTFNVLNGKSFITRSHGVSSVIYAYNPQELYKLQVFSPAQGIATLGQHGFNCYRGLNQFNLSSAISGSGTYHLCINDSNAVPPAVNVVIDTAVTPYKSIISYEVVSNAAVHEERGGDVFEPNKVIFPICHKIIYENHCDDFNFGEISYTDLDGMRRYLGGRIISDSDDVKTESYINTATEIYRTNPNRFVMSHTKVVKLALSDIDKQAYPFDLMYSDEILYRCWDGEWRNCSLKTTNTTREDESSYDIELEIIVSQ